MSELQSTRIHRGWLAKMVVFFIVLVAFGTWGLVDAVWIYPARGRAVADHAKYQLLQEAAKAGRLNNPADPSNTRPPLTIADPNARLAELTAREGLDESGRPADQADKAELRWLTALSRLAWPGKIDPKQTEIPDAVTELTRLDALWKTTQPPEPLPKWDLPLQWLFMAIGYAGAAFMFIRIGPALRRVYRWDPATLTLHLPDGQTLTPTDIREFDKRRWDKLYIDLHLENGRPSLPLDLQVYVPLEEWVLEMERARFPESASEESGEPAQPPQPADGQPASNPAGTPPPPPTAPTAPPTA